MSEQAPSKEWGDPAQLRFTLGLVQSVKDAGQEMCALNVDFLLWLLECQGLEPRTVTRVFILCNAYESGYGHGHAGDGLPNPYSPGGEEHEAYQTGVEAGYAASKRGASHEPRAICKTCSQEYVLSERHACPGLQPAQPPRASYSESDVMVFIGYLSASLPELAGVEIGRFHEHWDEYLKRAGLTKAGE